MDQGGKDEKAHVEIEQTFLTPCITFISLSELK